MEYRLYFLNRAGHITGARDLVCQDDREAIAMALADTDPRGKELWKGNSQVRCFPVFDPPDLFSGARSEPRRPPA